MQNLEIPAKIHFTHYFISERKTIRFTKCIK